MLLTTRGTDWAVLQTGQVIRLEGIIFCCDADDAVPGDGNSAGDYDWSFNNLRALDTIVANGGNFTHVRYGPFISAGSVAEGKRLKAKAHGPRRIALAPGQESGYLVVGSKQVDLDRWNPKFWARNRDLLAAARARGIYVEISVIDYWAAKPGNNDVFAWFGENNIQGFNDGECNAFRKPPKDRHFAWVEKLIQETGEFDNVLYNLGNEGFECEVKPAFEVAIAEHIKASSAYRGQPIGTNSQLQSVEQNGSIDYATYHDERAHKASERDRPTIVNEYSGISAAEYQKQAQFARDNGTTFVLWFEDMSVADRTQALAFFKAANGK